MIKMYRIDNGQISLAEFMSPFGKLDNKNRWVKIANMIPWSKFEEKYKNQFCTDNGAPAIKFRMAMGTLLIKQATGRSDDDILEDILESPYKQYLIGLHEFTTKPPFAQSSITNFRKYITSEMINEINDILFRSDDNDPNDNNGDSNNQEDDLNEEVNINEAQARDVELSADKQSEVEATQENRVENKGTLILDATCTPSDIAYPTDINLLNEAREKLEAIIDSLYQHSSLFLKPRTYRKVARGEYLQFILQKNPSNEKRREAIEQQLKYVKRNLKHTYNLLKTVAIEKLSKPQQAWLETIHLLYDQQQYMFQNNTHVVPNRIVSIGQPHVRPIKRSKAKANYEFGAKVGISLIEGYAFIDRLSWDSYNEESDLIPAVEAYKKQYGCYPERVLADQIYRNTANRKYCKIHGIRLSGPRLGRPPANIDRNELKIQAKDSADRNPVKGKFGEGKQKYGLGRIMARIKESCETVISLAFLCMNINRRLRTLLRFFISTRCFLVFKPLLFDWDYQFYHHRLFV